MTDKTTATLGLNPFLIQVYSNVSGRSFTELGTCESQSLLNSGLFELMEFNFTVENKRICLNPFLIQVYSNQDVPVAKQADYFYVSIPS